MYHAFIDLSRRKPYICGICRLDITHPCHQPKLIQTTYQAPDREEQGPLGRYAAIVTEQGMIALEEYREANIYVNGKIPCLSPLDQHQDGCACRECDPEDVLDYQDGD